MSVWVEERKRQFELYDYIYEEARKKAFSDLKEFAIISRDECKIGSPEAKAFAKIIRYAMEQTGEL